jgi:hypothetical protein
MAVVIGQRGHDVGDEQRDEGGEPALGPHR